MVGAGAAGRTPLPAAEFPAPETLYHPAAHAPPPPPSELRVGLETVRRPPAVPGAQLRPLRGGPRGARRTQRRRQVDAAQDPRRPGGAGLRLALSAQGG